MIPDTTYPKLARSFRRLGWIGFWVQIVLGITPLFMFGYFLFGKFTGTDQRVGFSEILALTGLAILAFTTLWSLRYVKLGTQINDETRRPTTSKIQNTLWIGLWASCAGIAISLALMFFEVIRLLVLFLKAPQGGVPVMQTQIEDRATWVSAMDVVSLLAELCTLAGELVVLGFTLWLLFRVARLHGTNETPAS
jgi:hypothetical protein